MIFAALNTYSSCDLIKPLPGCEGTNGSSGTGYEFEIPFTISPAKDTFAIGDTITIMSNFGDSLYNHLSQKYYQIGDFDFLISIYINDLKTDPMIGTKNYSVFPVIGTTKEELSSIGKQFFIKHEYKENNHRYTAKIILQEAGYFVFSPQSFISVYKLSDLEQHITDCEYESVNLTYNTNHSIDNNLYMNQFAADNDIRNWTYENIKMGGFYFFYVK